MPLYRRTFIIFLICAYKRQKIKECDCTPYIFLVFCGEGGSRTYGIIENHKISIRCKLSIYKIVKFIETHRVHFDI